MPDGMHEFLWFALGVFSYRIISSILHYGHLAVLLEEQLYHILKLLDILSKDLDNAMEMKYSIMKDAGTHEEEIKRIQESDNKSYKIWREMTVARIITHWPKIYRKIIRFNNWAGAMKYIRETKKVVAK
tara:strand:+ start:483 stop:869 length:387 start_codon:yes stop_codon:yes gene_type:complete